ncbi:MAG TPA: cytochrome B [Saprospirales bacterium]|nr:cytochrome B [Saprospirales bacterium]HAY71841.1 cytochrome B [Saprospirales bacterium]HRQ28610.1 cytochrome b/b6 domain-containing protein [Saprospiraceae bacterium]
MKSTNKVYIYKRFERFWHWAQAALIIFLAITGFEIHDSINIFGFEKAVEFHRDASIGLMILIIFAIFWHLAFDAWRQYIPTQKNLLAQIRFYTYGMFKGEPHPTEKTALQKLNPLQRLIYLGFKLFMIPIVVVTGLLYMFYKTIDVNNVVVISHFKLESIAVWHTFGAFLLIVFLIVHVYMTTTGHTYTSNIKAMITGYEEIETETSGDESTTTPDSDEADNLTEKN